MLTPIEQIKERLDIVDVMQGYIRLTKAGANYKACCPFHNEKTPSFTVSREKQLWHCFGCNAGGDIFSFIQQIEGVEFRDALRILADRAGVRLAKQDPDLVSEKSRLEKALQEASLYFQNQLLNSAEGKMAMEYLLKERGLTKQSIDKFEIGYAPNEWRGLAGHLAGQGIKKQDIANAGLCYEKTERPGEIIDRFRGRIMFPIFNQQGRITGFSGRIFPPAYQNKGQNIDLVGKYINTPQTPLFNKSALLYGLDKAKAAIRRQNSCIIVEGQMDVIASHQAGVENVVASSGTALTEEHLRAIRRLADNLILAFDLDSAGAAAARRSIDLAGKLGYNVKVVNNLSGKDAAEAIKENSENWKNAVLSAVNIMDFYFSAAFKDFDPKNVQCKKKAAAQILPAIAKISNGIEKAHYISQLAEKLGVRESILEGALSRSKMPARTGAINEENNLVKKIKTRRELLEERVVSVLASGKFSCLHFFKEENLTADALKNPELKKIAKIALALLGEKGCFDHKDIKALIKEERTGKILNYLLILAEDNSNADIAAETEKSIAELKELNIRDILKSLSDDIKKAEAEKDKDALNVLVEEFQKFSKKLKELKN